MRQQPEADRHRDAQLSRCRRPAPRRPLRHDQRLATTPWSCSVMLLPLHRSRRRSTTRSTSTASAAPAACPARVAAEHTVIDHADQHQRPELPVRHRPPDQPLRPPELHCGNAGHRLEAFFDNNIHVAPSNGSCSSAVNNGNLQPVGFLGDITDGLSNTAAYSEKVARGSATRWPCSTRSRRPRAIATSVGINSGARPPPAPGRPRRPDRLLHLGCLPRVGPGTPGVHARDLRAIHLKASGGGRPPRDRAVQPRHAAGPLSCDEFEQRLGQRRRGGHRQQPALRRRQRPVRRRLGPVHQAAAIAGPGLVGPRHAGRQGSSAMTEYCSRPTQIGNAPGPHVRPAGRAMATVDPAPLTWARSSMSAVRYRPTSRRSVSPP